MTDQAAAQTLPAIAEPTSLATPQKKEKKSRVPLRIQRGIDALVTGEARTQTDAAALAGLSRAHFCKALSKPHIEAFYAQRVAQNIRGARMRAGAKLVALIEAESEHVAYKAADRILTDGGILKPDHAHGGVNVSVGIVNNVAPGYVIDLSDPRVIDDTTPRKEE